MEEKTYKIEVIKGDITEITVDAIVNAANNSLLGGGGVDGAIHKRGGRQILAECVKIRCKQGECKTGEAVYTTAGQLPALYVIHTVGPLWTGGMNDEAKFLANSYINSLKLANELNVTSIAFPNISTGVYDYPKDKAAAIVVKTVKDFMETENKSIGKVIFVCFDDKNYEIYKNLLNAGNEIAVEPDIDIDQLIADAE